MEVISGDTIPSLDADRFDNTGLPFSPTSPSLPIISGGTVSKTEAITLRKTDHDNRFPTIKDRSKPEKEVVEIPVEKDFPDIPEISSPSIVLENSGEKVRLPVTGRQMVSPRPLVAEKPRRTDRIQDIYRMSKQVLETNNLKQFAAIDLVPDKALRIILTGDLLFETSKAELSLESREKLEKIASAIHTIPYIINVVGHTDNVPISSSRYTSNWELSVSRASTVARFLIETTEMDPNQFIVSGYSSYRPLVPNTSAENRMKNRRVEIIISKRLPKPVQARTTTFN
jgi:chemotaxis protein MotB